MGCPDPSYFPLPRLKLLQHRRLQVKVGGLYMLLWILQVPIAVRDKHKLQSEGSGWRIITWIDSKATFGDDRTHSKQLEEQYSTCVGLAGCKQMYICCWQGA